MQPRFLPSPIGQVHARIFTHLHLHTKPYQYAEVEKCNAFVLVCGMLLHIMWITLSYTQVLICMWCACVRACRLLNREWIKFRRTAWVEELSNATSLSQVALALQEFQSGAHSLALALTHNTSVSYNL